MLNQVLILQEVGVGNPPYVILFDFYMERYLIHRLLCSVFWQLQAPCTWSEFESQKWSFFEFEPN